MNLAQPAAQNRQLYTTPLPSHTVFIHHVWKKKLPSTRLTPISALPAKVFTRVRHQHHGQNELELLQRFLPFPLRVGFLFFFFRDVRGGGGVGEGIEVRGGRRRMGMLGRHMVGGVALDGGFQCVEYGELLEIRST